LRLSYAPCDEKLIPMGTTERFWYKLSSQHLVSSYVTYFAMFNIELHSCRLKYVSCYNELFNFKMTNGNLWFIEVIRFRVLRRYVSKYMQRCFLTKSTQN
jgi:hypothetical protein